jgi:hypothetical protein
MLPAALIQEVDRLLQDGQLSHREIAAQLGVSRGTVNAVANGSRRHYGNEPHAGDIRLSTAASSAVRCPRCGYRVYAPCLICRTRDHKHRQQGQRH